jgi:hypothetical protein
MLALVITAVVTALAWIINMVPSLGVTVKPLFSLGPLPVDPYTPFTPTIANQLMTWFAGATSMIPGGSVFNLTAMLVTFVAALAIVITGQLLFSFIPMLRISKNGKRNEIFNVIIAGTLIWYAILVGFVLPQAGVTGVAAGLLIYAAAIAIISPFVADLVGIKV